MTETIGERLRRLRFTINPKLSQEDFGAPLKIKQATLTGYETGKRDIPAYTVKSICNYYKVREEWLLHGEGEIFLVPEPIPASDLIDRLQEELNLTETVTRLLRRFVELEEADREKVLEAVDLMLGEKKEENSQKKTANSKNIRKVG
ncbi:MAG: helix-turn-helix transcriptional regulator [Bacilli bacterium]|nr:helix-turn-helix transcriptional regulator [Bacilli bacterium]